MAANGIGAFYEGEFAKACPEDHEQTVASSTRRDMAKGHGLAKTPGASQKATTGDSRSGHLALACFTYALHLSEALDLRASGPPGANPESVFRQLRVLEEVFHSTKTYSKRTHEEFASPEYARKRAQFVLTSPVRDVTIDAIFNTCFLVVRDKEGNAAWGTHSINTPTAFGAGILVEGVYAGYAIDRDHVRGDGATASGISTSYALYRDGIRGSSLVRPGSGSSMAPTSTERAWSSGTSLPSTRHAPRASPSPPTSAPT